MFTEGPIIECVTPGSTNDGKFTVCWPKCNPDCRPENETCSPTCWPYCNPDCNPEKPCIPCGPGNC